MKLEIMKHYIWLAENEYDSQEGSLQEDTSSNNGNISHHGNDRKRFNIRRYATRIVEERFYLFLHGNVGRSWYW